MRTCAHQEGAALAETIALAAAVDAAGAAAPAAAAAVVAAAAAVPAAAALRHPRRPDGMVQQLESGTGERPSHAAAVHSWHPGLSGLSCPLTAQQRRHAF